MGHPRHQREEACPLHCLARCQGEGTHGPPMKASQESQEPLPTGVPARDLHGRFHGFRAAVGEEHLLVPAPRCHLRQLLGQGHLRIIVEIRAREVEEPGCLLLHCLHHPGMRMPHVHDRYAAGKVEIGVAVNIGDLSALSVGDGHRGRLGCGRKVSMVRSHYLPRPGPGRLREHVGDPSHFSTG